MRCAECGEKITRKPIKRGKQVYCSAECADAADYASDHEFDENRYDDEYEDSYGEDTDDRYVYDEDDDR